MAAQCQLATTESVAAFWVPGELWVRAVGSTTQSCWDVAIQKSPLAVWPPEFAVEQCRTSDICLERITPYEVVGRFPMNTAPESIIVHTADGAQSIPVEVVPDMAGLSANASVGVAVGRSIEDAFRAAVRLLPPTDPPNAPRSFDVRIRYQDGGITGPLVIVYLD